MERFAFYPDPMSTYAMQCNARANYNYPYMSDSL